MGESDCFGEEIAFVILSEMSEANEVEESRLPRDLSTTLTLFTSLKMTRYEKVYSHGFYFTFDSAGFVVENKK